MKIKLIIFSTILVLTQYSNAEKLIISAHNLGDGKVFLTSDPDTILTEKLASDEKIEQFVKEFKEKSSSIELPEIDIYFEINKENWDSYDFDTLQARFGFNLLTSPMTSPFKSDLVLSGGNLWYYGELDGPIKLYYQVGHRSMDRLIGELSYISNNFSEIRNLIELQKKSLPNLRIVMAPLSSFNKNLHSFREFLNLLTTKVQSENFSCNENIDILLTRQLASKKEVYSITTKKYNFYNPINNYIKAFDMLKSICSK